MQLHPVPAFAPSSPFLAGAARPAQAATSSRRAPTAVVAEPNRAAEAPFFVDDDASDAAGLVGAWDEPEAGDEDETFGFEASSLDDANSPAPPVRTVAAEPVFGNGSFGALGLQVQVCAALSAAGIVRPTRVQQRGIPVALGGADVIIGAATGSGKTLAYLLPVVSLLKAEEELREDGGVALRVARRPRAVVIVPTRELAEQVLGVAKGLSYGVKIRVVGTTTGTGGKGMRKLLDLVGAAPIDVLVTTTGRMLQLLESRAVDLRFVKHFVVDEVDTMFDAGFGPELQQILRAARGGKTTVVNKPQCIAVGATHPKAAELLYAEEFPDAKRIDVDLHLPPPGLESRFIRTNAEGKLPELVAMLGDSKKRGDLAGGRLIIFCNTISSARFVEHYLSECGYTTSCIHGEIPPERRVLEFQSFKTGTVQLLVCTDIAARGLDNLDIAHVVIFDFPTSAVDYIHRAGRTARAGAKGRVTSLVLKRDLSLARAIERSGKEKNDALISARIAREEEDARKSREEGDRKTKAAARESGKDVAEYESKEWVGSGTGSRRGGMRGGARGGARGGGRGGGRGGARSSFGGGRGGAGGYRGRGGGRGRGRGGGGGRGRGGGGVGRGGGSASY